MSEDLKIRLEVENIKTLEDAKRYLKQLNTELGKVALDNIPKQKQLGDEIVKTKNIIADATQHTVTANGKIMKSYFSTGEELRRFYREQRVGDRTMREATQAAAGFGAMFGDSGLGKIVGTTTGAFQQAEFAVTGVGIAAQSAGGKFAILGRGIMAVAPYLAIAVAAWMLFSKIIGDAAEKLKKFHDEFVGFTKDFNEGLTAKSAKAELPAMTKALDAQRAKLKKLKDEHTVFGVATTAHWSDEIAQQSNLVDKYQIQVDLYNSLIEKDTQLAHTRLLSGEAQKTQLKDINELWAKQDALREVDKQRGIAFIKSTGVGTKQSYDVSGTGAGYQFGGSAGARAGGYKFGGNIMGAQTEASKEYQKDAQARAEAEKQATEDYLINPLKSGFTNVANSAQDSMHNMFVNVVGGANSLFQQMLIGIGDALAGTLIDKAIGGIFGLIGLAKGGDVFTGNKLQFAASGGNFKYGNMQNVIVGERGPEMMQVGKNGVRVISNHEMKNVQSGGMDITTKQIETKIEGDKLVVVHQMAIQRRKGRTG
jgi:hypothetical protein